MRLFGCGCDCVRSGDVGGGHEFVGFGMCLGALVGVGVVFRGVCSSARVLLLLFACQLGSSFWLHFKFLASMLVRFFCERAEKSFMLVPLNISARTSLAWGEFCCCVVALAGSFCSPSHFVQLTIDSDRDSGLLRLLERFYQLIPAFLGFFIRRQFDQSLSRKMPQLDCANIHSIIFVRITCISYVSKIVITNSV